MLLVCKYPHKFIRLYTYTLGKDKVYFGLLYLLSWDNSVSFSS